jgi:hypothetical protein
MNEGRRVGGIAAVAALAVFLAGGAGLLVLRHVRLMRAYRERLGAIVGLAEAEAGLELADAGHMLRYQTAESEDARPFRAVRREWRITIESQWLDMAGKHPVLADVSVVCTHAPLSLGRPRVEIVDWGAGENARFLEKLRAALDAREFSYTIVPCMETRE